KGLGHQFLRHIERARVLAVLVDLAPYDQRPPTEQLEVLLHELEEYQPDLLDRPRVILGSKADVAEFELPSDAIALSAVTGEGLSEALGAIAALVRESREELEPGTGAIAIHRPQPEGISVVRGEDGGFVVLGRAAERAVALNDVTNDDAAEFVRERLHRLGVDKALQKAGAREGDSVVIGELVFDYRDDGG
ncbi:MAG: Obg family GTPase CgtA, partial [Acidimicrobiales bacterium]